MCGALDTVLVNQSVARVPVFRGIRYGAPPTDTARWSAPGPAAAAVGTIQATTFGAVCPQGDPGKSTAQGSEDCLFLNVWKPSTVPPGTTLPVMVFIHGGAYVMGAGSAVTYTGAYLAQSNNAVVVTINYRLGALGFLYTGTVGSRRVAGNQALLDQQLALTWVRDNIASFGGDRTRVTVFGESAGAMSVGFHLLTMPSSSSLFRAAIMQSNPMGVLYRDTAQARRDGDGFLMHLCKATDGLAKKDCWTADKAREWFATNAAKPSRDQILRAQASFDGETSATERMIRGGLVEGLPWTPVVDSALVMGQPLRGYAPGMPRKPLLFGFNKDEGVVFAAADSLMSPASYRSLLARVFPGHADTVQKYRVGGVAPYGTDTDSVVTGLSRPASAFSHVLCDMVFKCGSLAAADLAAKNAPSTAPVYAYAFERSPVPIAMYPTGSQCLPGNGRVCHADELPYVFYTLAKMASVKPRSDTVTAADTALSRRMAAAWGSFARDPQTAPADNWSRYTVGGAAYVWGGPNDGTMRSGVANAANCSLWNGFSPIGVASSRDRAAARRR